MLEYHHLIAILLLACYTRLSEQHGYLHWPPQRSSLWRYNYETPPNYNDNSLWCGGIAYFTEAGGRCGTCGDPFYGPHDNEAGGKYALGIIGARYPEGTKAIEVTVKVNALHKGFFEFKLCPHNNPVEPVKQSCLDQHSLRIEEGSPDTGYKLYYPLKDGDINLTLAIPRGISCSQCVLQWRYKTGNSWGTDAEGNSCLGCGIQEQFQNCADISIGYGTSTTTEPLGETNSFHPLKLVSGISKSSSRVPIDRIAETISHTVLSLNPKHLENVHANEHKNTVFDSGRGKPAEFDKGKLVSNIDSKSARRTRRRGRTSTRRRSSLRRTRLRSSSSRRPQRRIRRMRTSRRRNAAFQSLQKRLTRNRSNSRIRTRSRNRSRERVPFRRSRSRISRLSSRSRGNLGQMVQNLMRINSDRSRSSRRSEEGGANNVRSFFSTISRSLPRLRSFVDPCVVDPNHCNKH